LRLERQDIEVECKQFKALITAAAQWREGK
jgi:hypothetical protein